MDMCSKKESIKVSMADSIAAGMGNLCRKIALKPSSGVIAGTTTIRIR